MCLIRRSSLLHIWAARRSALTLGPTWRQSTGLLPRCALQQPVTLNLRSHTMSVNEYTERCLDRSLWSEPADAGWLAPEELDALTASGNYDPTVHREDGSMVGFTSQDQRQRRNEILKNLNRLHPELKKIVDAELKKGNHVIDAGCDYPHAGSVHVTMSKRFSKAYENSEARFALCNDPHYWHADYSTLDEPAHLLIC